MFRPDTFEAVKRHATIGVKIRQKDRFAVEPGDRFVTYISRVQQLDAFGEIVSKPFEDTSAIFGEDSARYSWRAKVKLHRTGLARDGRRLLFGVSVFDKELSTTPANLLLCGGGFVAITPEDYEWLVGCMEGRIQPKWEGVSDAQAT